MTEEYARIEAALRESREDPIGRQDPHWPRVWCLV